MKYLWASHIRVSGEPFSESLEIGKTWVRRQFAVKCTGIHGKGSSREFTGKGPEIEPGSHLGNWDSMFKNQQCFPFFC